MPPAAIIAGAAGSVIGGIGGAMPSTSTTVKNVQNMGMDEYHYQQLQNQQLAQMKDFTNAGPGMSDYLAGNQAQRNYGNMLGDWAQNGPSQNAINTGNTYAASQFAPQQMMLNQSFDMQRQQSQQQAAVMGRGGNDPILQYKLAQEQSRQQQLLGAQQGAFASNYTMNQPLTYAGQQANVLGALGQQAMSNRQTLLGLGNQLMTQDRNYRLAAAGATTTEGGGLGGAMKGVLAGAGAGASAYSKIASI